MSDLSSRYYINLLRHRDVRTREDLLKFLFREVRVDKNIKRYMMFIVPQRARSLRSQFEIRRLGLVRTGDGLVFQEFYAVSQSDLVRDIRRNLGSVLKTIDLLVAKPFHYLPEARDLDYLLGVMEDYGLISIIKYYGRRGLFTFGRRPDVFDVKNAVRFAVRKDIGLNSLSLNALSLSFGVPRVIHRQPSLLDFFEKAEAGEEPEERGAESAGPRPETLFIAKIIVAMLNRERVNPDLVNFRALEARICRELESLGYRVVSQALHGSFPILTNPLAFPRYVAIQVRKSLSEVGSDWKRLIRVARTITSDYIEAIFVVLTPMYIRPEDERKYRTRTWVVVYYNGYLRRWRYIPRLRKM